MLDSIIVLWLLQVPFEVLVRQQIARLLEPNLQCAQFIYDELVKVNPGLVVAVQNFCFDVCCMDM